MDIRNFTSPNEITDFLMTDFLNDIHNRYNEIKKLRDESSFESVVEHLTADTKKYIDFMPKVPGERGYCLWAYLLPWYKQKKKYGLHKFIPNDMGKHTRIIYFFDHMMKNYSDFLIRPEPGLSISETLDKNKIKSGAIILIGNYKDVENSHVYLYFTENDEKFMMSFNNEGTEKIRNTDKQFLILDSWSLIHNEVLQHYDNHI